MIEGNRFKMYLGLPGAGKTLGMVEEEVLPHLLNGEQVYSNFWINWKGDNLHFFTRFDEILHVTNCVVAIDEIGRFLDPRNWEKETGEIRRWFQLHRHNHIDVFGTTQDISLIAKSALIVVDEFIYCEQFLNGWLAKAVMAKLHLNYVCVRYEKMSFSELKAMASGNSVVAESTQELLKSTIKPKGKILDNFSVVN